MTGGIKYWRRIAPVERDRTFDAYEELVESAARALSAGFHPGERHEVLVSHARRLGVWVWPALADQIIRDARREALPSWRH